MDGLPPSMWTDRALGRFMALRNNPSDPKEVTTCLSFVNGAMAKFIDRLALEDAVELILRELADMRPSTKGALKHVKTWSWNRNVFAGAGPMPIGSRAKSRALPRNLASHADGCSSQASTSP